MSLTANKVVSPTNKRVAQMISVQKEGLELFKKKNADYGDSFATYGPVGVIVRMGDKINRLSSVTNKGINLVDNESVRDTLIDLHNYAPMAIMLFDNKQQIANPRVENFKKETNSISINPLHRRLKQNTFRENNKLKIDIPARIHSFNKQHAFKSFEPKR